MPFNVLLLDVNGDPLTSSDMTLAVSLQHQEFPETIYEASLVEKVRESYYYIEITAFIRGTYDLIIEIIDIQTSESLGILGQTPAPIYWDSHFAYYQYSTISGPALTVVYTSFIDTF